MRITRQQLHEMIDEEVASVLMRASNRRSMLEAVGGAGGPLSGVDPADLIEFGDAYIRLGREGRGVLKLLVEDPTELGPDAEVEIDAIEMEVSSMNDMIADAVAEWRGRDPQA